ncbi:MAG: ParB N-terminal domain-containing protein [Thermodesulfovibrionales bacterium]|jgi:hypothetical protein
MKKKVAEINSAIKYAVFCGGQTIPCEPSSADIQDARDQKNYETRSFQDPKVLAELGTDAIKHKKFHAEKIAYFAAKGCKEPILLYNDETTILDGLHRVKAAKCSGLEEVDVIVIAQPPTLSEETRNKLWSAIARLKDPEGALKSLNIPILKK